MTASVEAKVRIARKYQQESIEQTRMARPYFSLSIDVLLDILIRSHSMSPMLLRKRHGSRCAALQSKPLLMNS